jgi:hypothetical protein
MTTIEVTDLPNGASHYDGKDTVYCRGDGLFTCVTLPDGKSVVSIDPAYAYFVDLNYPDVLEFSADEGDSNYAIPPGELVTITLRDAE